MTDITRKQRALLIVSCLSGGDYDNLLYRFLETSGVAIARRYLEHHYSITRAIEQENATMASFLDTLESLTNNRNILALDLFVILHGYNGGVRFYDDHYNNSKLSEQIKEKARRGRLRFVYNLSCYGDSHAKAFLDAGFVTHIGSRAINTSSGSEYRPFCKAWGEGNTATKTLDEADRAWARRTSDRIAAPYIRILEKKHNTSYEIDSTKIIRGNPKVTISTEVHKKVKAENQAKLIRFISALFQSLKRIGR